MATVTASVVPGITVNYTATEVAGATTEIQTKLPASYTPVAFTNGTGGSAVEKMYVNQISLSSSTPQTLDLTALTGGAGDTSFAKVKIIGIYNNETRGTGKKVTVGAAASDSFQFGLSAAGTIDVPAGHALTLANSETAGWTTTSATDLKLDPGSNAVSVTVLLVGN